MFGKSFATRVNNIGRSPQEIAAQRQQPGANLFGNQSTRPQPGGLFGGGAVNPQFQPQQPQGQGQGFPGFDPRISAQSQAILNGAQPQAPQGDGRFGVLSRGYGDSGRSFLQRLAGINQR